MTVLTGNRTPRVDDTPSSSSRSCTSNDVTATRIPSDVSYTVTKVNNYGTKFVLDIAANVEYAQDSTANLCVAQIPVWCGVEGRPTMRFNRKRFRMQTYARNMIMS